MMLSRAHASAKTTSAVPSVTSFFSLLSPSMNGLSFSRIPLIFRCLSVSFSICRRGDGGSRRFFRRSYFHPVPQSLSAASSSVALAATPRHGHSVEHVAGEEEKVMSDFSDEMKPLESFEEERWDFSKIADEGEVFDLVGAAKADVRHTTVELEVKELEDMPEQWRRSRLAWLCKELPSHKAGTLVRILNAQRKWMRQEDAIYVAVHCMRIRENDVSFRVYRWMAQQHWYRFDFGLATKLADYLGKERKFAKCREIFDDILNQGRVPSESTFHILVVAYLGAPVEGCLEEACDIYNRMIQLGGYQPRLSLHNSLFKALISKQGGLSKNHLKQAEFIFHNLVTTGLEVQKDIYRGLIWLHSYQDIIDKERISFLREEMRKAGFEEDKEVLVSMLRACAKEGDVKESERFWAKLIGFDGSVPSQAFVYRMEVYSKVGEFLRSLEIFRDMERQLGSASIAGYQKIIEILCKFQQVEMVESLMRHFTESGMKPLTPSYIDIMKMYLELDRHDKVGSAFLECIEKCRANQSVYNIYLESLVKAGNFDKAKKLFDEMHNGAIGVNSRSCNTVLKGYINSGSYAKAEKIYVLMCQKKYDIEPPLIEKLEDFLRTSRKEIKKPLSLKLSIAQREILVGMLLGGLEIESDEARKNHTLRFEFRQKLEAHSILRKHIHNQFHEWLNPRNNPDNDANGEVIPFRFPSITHSYFGFYADQFWPKGHPEIPKLIHRWLSPRALAYWYMYGGHRTSSGDIVLKLKGNLAGVERIVKGLRAKSLECRVKKKGGIFWIGILETNSVWFWKLVEPYVLDELTDLLKPRDQMGVETETRAIDFGNGSDHSDDDG